MNNLKNYIFICFFSTLIFACASSKNTPVIQDYVGTKFWGESTTHVFSLTPERRTIIVMPRREFIDDKVGRERVFKFCAEPPPDVAESIADSFRILAEAQLGKSTDINASVELAKTFASSPQSLFYRSQGVQLFRDGMYNLCQAYLNGIIDTDSKYLNWYEELRKQAIILISKEIDKMQEIRIYESNAQAINAMNESIQALKEIKMQTEAITKMKDQLEEKQGKIIEDIKKIKDNQSKKPD